jgi:hypothetical protein
MTATNYTDDKRNLRNPANALVRFEFLEILIRLALDKYLKSGQAQNSVEAVTRFMDGIRDFLKTIDCNTLRWARYICEDVDLIFKRYLSLFKNLFAKYSGRKTRPGCKIFMSLEEF